MPNQTELRQPARARARHLTVQVPVGPSSTGSGNGRQAEADPSSSGCWARARPEACTTRQRAYLLLPHLPRPLLYRNDRRAPHSVPSKLPHRPAQIRPKSVWSQRGRFHGFTSSQIKSSLIRFGDTSARGLADSGSQSSHPHLGSRVLAGPVGLGVAKTRPRPASRRL